MFKKLTVFFSPELQTQIDASRVEDGVTITTHQKLQTIENFQIIMSLPLELANVGWGTSKKPIIIATPEDRGWFVENDKLFADKKSAQAKRAWLKTTVRNAKRIEIHVRRWLVDQFGRASFWLIEINFFKKGQTDKQCLHCHLDNSCGNFFVSGEENEHLLK